MSLIRRRAHRLGLLLLAAILLPPVQRGRESIAASQGRQWMEAYVRQSPRSSPRRDRYLERINRYCSDYCDVDEDWFLETERAATFSSRTRTNQAARLAFAYATRGARYYQNPIALEKLRKVFAGVASHVDDEGRFTWEERLNEHGYASQQHEHAWRLEPLLLAFIWLKDDLPPPEQADAEKALRRAAKWLFDHPKTETNNRGVVWAAVLAMAGVYYEEPAWRAKVEEHAGEIIRGVVRADGEIGENTEQYAGGGPDANYTYTSLSYLYMYDLWSGDPQMKHAARRAMKWLSGYTTLSGWPVVVGASVRTGGVNQKNISDCLPYFERFSGEDPLYAELAENILTKLKRLDISPWGHIVSPLIWALLEAGAEAPQDGLDWRNGRRTDLFSRPHVHYSLVRRRYQTGITFRARRGSYTPNKPNYRSIPTDGMPLRGLQVWAWDEEPPLILHAKNGDRGGFSFTQAGGVNTATVDVSKNPTSRDWEVDLKKQKPPGGDADLAVITTRRDNLWTLYAFTPASTVAVYGGPAGPYRTSWSMNPSYLARKTVDAASRTVRFEGRQGELHYLTGRGAEFPDRVEIRAPEGPVAFGFSNKSFRFTAYDAAAETLEFADASGDYRLTLTQILADGVLDRAAPVRLRKKGGRGQSCSARNLRVAEPK